MYNAALLLQNKGNVVEEKNIVVSSRYFRSLNADNLASWASSGMP